MWETSSGEGDELADRQVNGPPRRSRGAMLNAMRALALCCTVCLIGISASPLTDRGSAAGTLGPGSGVSPPRGMVIAAGNVTNPILWSGTAKGGIFIQRHKNTTDLVVDDQQNYQATLNFSFRIETPGALLGDGNGTYAQATWHLDGTYNNQSFSCDPPMTADPFTVAVGGTAANRTLNLSLDLPDAVESNVDYDCGANFTAYGGSTQYLRESLQSVETNGIIFDMTSPASVTLTNQTDTNSTEFEQIIKDSSWTISVQHPCAESNYSNPSTSGYINQYDAGTNLNLPEATDGKRGGNACGPSSLVMAIDALKEAAGSSTRMNLKDVYTQTMTDGWTQDGVNNAFDWGKAEAWAKSKGYSVTLGDGIAFIDSQLANGSEVLASTLFSSKAQSNANPYGGGHVVLFTGLTANGDYITSDPAGDYFASDSGHYGSGKCGSDTIYPKNVTDDRLYNDDGTTRPALAIQGLGTGDPEYLLVIGWFNGTGPSPFDLTVVDGQGEKAGFLPSGSMVQDIPGSEIRLAPQYPSDPDAPSMPAPNQTWWPQSILLPVTQDPSTLTISVTGRSAADYRIEVYLAENGTAVRDANVTGHVGANETLSFPVQSAPGNAGLLWEIAGLAAIVGVVAVAILLWIRRKRGPAASNVVAPSPTEAESRENLGGR